MIRQFIKISIVNKMFINNSVVTQSLCEIENIEKKKKKTDRHILLSPTEARNDHQATIL